jgi:hypothetical protein
MTENELQLEIKGLWQIVKRLEEKYKADNRKFTIDGHLLGSIGEVYVKGKFGLELLKNSHENHDAIERKTKKLYQIKTTQRDRIGLTKRPDNLIVVEIDNEGRPNIAYYGDGTKVWDIIKFKTSKQKFISLRQLKNLK